MMTDEEYTRRVSEDFQFMVLCESKGNMAMYRLLRDRELDAERKRRTEVAQQREAMGKVEWPVNQAKEERTV